MTTKYLLPCQCGRTIPIEPGQAGQGIKCECGESIVAPSMRAVRELEPVPQAESQAESKTSRQWTPAAGSTFVAGALLVIVGLLTLGFASFSRYLLMQNLPVRDEAQVQQWLGEIDYGQPTELIEIWKDTVGRGLSDVEDSPWQELRGEVRKYARASWVGVGVLVVGMILAGGSVLLKA